MLGVCGCLLWQDIRLCSYAIEAAGEQLRLRALLRLLNAVRTWVFLPAMVITVLYLVIIKGGDALTVVLNTVAILFLCEVDNAAYMIGLGEAATGLHCLVLCFHFQW